MAVVSPYPGRLKGITIRKLRNIRSRRSQRKVDSPCAAELQTLESRELLSATVSNGTLFIQAETEGRAVPRVVVTEQRG